MKKFLVKIAIILGILGINISNIFALKLLVPTPSGQDDIIVNGSTQIKTDEVELIDTINIVNEYLWFILAGLAFVIFVIAGIKLIAGGAKDNLSKANKMLVGSAIAIVVSMLSYALVKLLINLF